MEKDEEEDRMDDKDAVGFGWFWTKGFKICPGGVDSGRERGWGSGGLRGGGDGGRNGRDGWIVGSGGRRGRDRVGGGGGWGGGVDVEGEFAFEVVILEFKLDGVAVKRV